MEVEVSVLKKDCEMSGALIAAVVMCCAINLVSAATYRDEDATRLTLALKIFEQEQPLRAPNKQECAVCKSIIADLDRLLSNETLDNITFPLIEEFCTTHFPNASSVCDLVGGILLRLANSALAELGRLHWNLPVSICADVLHLCSEPCCANDYKPEQLHLSYHGSLDATATSATFNIVWITLKNTSDVVRYRLQGSDVWNETTQCIQDHYTKGDWIGIIHSCEMSNLERNQTYEYSVGSLVHGMSNVTKFSTLPFNIATPQRPLRILAVADMGFGPNSDYTVKRMIEQVDAGSVDLVLHYGDIGYADGNEPDWDKFGRKIEAISSRVPYMTTPGNHECLFNFTAYMARMRMPVPSWKTGVVLPPNYKFYSFEVDKFLFLMLDTETWLDTANVSPVERQWLREQFPRAHTKGQFIFTAQHRPLYCSHDLGDHADCTSRAKLLRSQVEQMYVDNGVDFVIAGHLHNYERTYPIAGNGSVPTRNYSNPGAPVYVVNGAAGNKEGQIYFAPHQSNTWSAFKSVDVGYMKVEMSFDAQEKVFVMKSWFYRSRDNAVVDEFTLRRRHH